MCKGPGAPADPTEAGEVEAVEAGGGAGAAVGLTPPPAAPGLKAPVDWGMTEGGLSSYKPPFIIVHQEVLPDAVAGDPAMLHSGPEEPPMLATLSA